MFGEEDTLVTTETLNSVTLNKCIRDAHAFFRKITKNMKEAMGPTW
jgi:hypothetical protein